jgi:two-component system alkaline phosphatase synthesis response regulator PhoP
MKKILVVDDEENILELIKYNLTQEGYDLSLAIDGKEALEKVEEFSPDLIILDIMLPGKDGFEICEILQDEDATRKIPIIFLSARGEVEDKVRGLELGATDYLTKPFSPRELLSRVRTIFRRIDFSSLDEEKDFFKYGKLTVDLKGYQVLVNEEKLELTNKEFSLLTYLLNREGEVCSRDDLLEEVWGYDSFSGIRTVDVHIRMLRKKFNKCDINKLSIETVRGIGYRLVSS